MTFVKVLASAKIGRIYRTQVANEIAVLSMRCTPVKYANCKSLWTAHTTIGTVLQFFSLFLLPRKKQYSDCNRTNKRIRVESTIRWRYDLVDLESPLGRGTFILIVIFIRSSPRVTLLHVRLLSETHCLKISHFFFF